mgnify:CR=1 FL=1
MKRRLLALLLCVAMVLSLIGCTQAPPAETTVPSTAAPTEPAAADIYASAREMSDAIRTHGRFTVPTAFEHTVELGKDYRASW